MRHGPRTGRIFGTTCAVEEPDGQTPLCSSTVKGEMISGRCLENQRVM